ncbi:hypothetical protein [Nocardia bhagyanarayanae]|nr:hypothetical protein [Nocardia bhagyanarayanae]
MVLNSAWARWPLAGWLRCAGGAEFGVGALAAGGLAALRRRC